MAFYLKVVGGADDGTSHRVDPGDMVIGRAPSAKIKLQDESIAWEHAIVKDSGTRITVSNLAASGTKIRGKRITEETRIGGGDEIVLSPKVKLIVENRAAAAAAVSRTTLGLLFTAVIVLAGGAGVLMIANKPVQTRTPMLSSHWRAAYMRLCERMEKWVGEGRVPDEALILFRDAWRYEQSGSLKESEAKWNQMQRVLRSLPAPNSQGLSKLRFPETVKGSQPKALDCISGKDLDTEFNSNSDEAFAEALVWFVRFRTKSVENQLKD